MRRREFITLIGSAAVALPRAAGAQRAGEMHRIGFLGSAPDNPLFAQNYPVFLAELRRLGFTEGENLAIHRTDR